MNKQVLVAISLLLFLFPVVGHGESWNLNKDFSATLNPNGAWAFGWRATAIDPLILYTDTSPHPLCPPDPNTHYWSYQLDPLSLLVAKNYNNHVWPCNGCDYPANTVWFHPGTTQQSVVRWTTPKDMGISMVANFLALDTGSSVIHIYRNGSEMFSDTLGGLGATADFSATITSHASDTIDIAIDAISHVDDSVKLEVIIGPSVGACCFPSGACLEGTAEDCERVGGIYQGDGVPCDPGICISTVTDPNTWGIVKRLYR